MKRNIVHILAIACLSATLLLSCGGKKNEVDTGIIHNPNSAEGYNDKEHIPVLAFDKNMHDFGTLTQGENIAYSFKFTNKGNADLVIQNCEATCGCTVADFPREKVAPGETGYVTVSFNSAGKMGQQLQEVTVVSNAQPSRTKIRIQAKVK